MTLAWILAVLLILSLLVGLISWARGDEYGGKLIWSGKKHIVKKRIFSHYKSNVQVHGIKTKNPNDLNRVGIKITEFYSSKHISLTTEQANELIEELNFAIKTTNT